VSRATFSKALELKEVDAERLVQQLELSDTAQPRNPRLTLAGLVRTARPRQWLKNFLVFAAPLAAGTLFHAQVLLQALATFGVFCLAASGTYFVNDALDAASDSHHPVKRTRPVAAGVLSPQVATLTGALLAMTALGLSWLVSGGRLVLVVALYLTVSSAYSLRLKHEPVVDLACVSAGFVLRAIAGAVATAVVLSNWFLIVSSFGSLFVVAGKRSAEHVKLGDQRSAHRKALSAYPAAYLRSVRLICAGVTLSAYCLWAFERARQMGAGHHPIWFELSIVPFVMGLLHAELRFERGDGGAPEELAFGDRFLQVVAIAWVTLFALGVYA